MFCFACALCFGIFKSYIIVLVCLCSLFIRGVWVRRKKKTEGGRKGERNRGREHVIEVGWVGRWRRSEWSWGKKKNMIKKCCMK